MPGIRPVTQAQASEAQQGSQARKNEGHGAACQSDVEHQRVTDNLFDGRKLRMPTVVNYFAL